MSNGVNEWFYAPDAMGFLVALTLQPFWMRRHARASGMNNEIAIAID